MKAELFSIRQRRSPATLNHCNEVANDYGKAAASTTNAMPRPTAKVLIRSTITGTHFNRPRTSMAYEWFSWKAGCKATSNRADAILLAGQSSGHTLLFGPAANATCPLYMEVIDQTSAFSGDLPSVVLHLQLEKVLALVRATS